MDAYPQEPEVHAYLRTRLAPFDLPTLHELHYQMISLGKVVRGVCAGVFLRGVGALLCCGVCAAPLLLLRAACCVCAV